MKAYISFVITIILCFVLSSCSQKQNDSTNNTTEISQEDMLCDSAIAVDITQTEVSNTDNTYEEDNDDNDSNLKINLAKAIQCIADNDAEGFASRCHYPVRVNPLGKMIETPENMVKLFDILFPKDQCDLFKDKTENDWEEMGWRGIMYDRGEFWSEYGDGKISVINFSSKAIKEVEEKEKEVASSCLHPSLQGREWEIINSFKCNNGIIFRIDRRDEDEKYRFILFKQGESFNEIPSYVMFGDWNDEDEGYHFSDDEGKTAKFYELRVYQYSPYVLILSDSTEIGEISRVNWLDLLENHE